MEKKSETTLFDLNDWKAFEHVREYYSHKIGLTKLQEKFAKIYKKGEKEVYQKITELCKFYRSKRGREIVEKHFVKIEDKVKENRKVSVEKAYFAGVRNNRFDVLEVDYEGKMEDAKAELLDDAGKYFDKVETAGMIVRVLCTNPESTLLDALNNTDKLIREMRKYRFDERTIMKFITQKNEELVKERRGAVKEKKREDIIDEKVKPLACVKYEKIEGKEDYEDYWEALRINRGGGRKKIQEKGSVVLEKYPVMAEGRTRYVLSKTDFGKSGNPVMKIWQFKENFNGESALNFVKQFEKWEKETGRKTAGK